MLSSMNEFLLATFTMTESVAIDIGIGGGALVLLYRACRTAKFVMKAVLVIATLGAIG